MKKNFNILLIFFILLFSPIKGNAEYLILGDPWPPWTGEKYGETTQGLAVNIINDIFTKTNDKVKIELHPWKRVLSMVKYGQADGILMIKPSKETSDFLLYTDPIFMSKEVLCFNKLKTPDFKWSEITDLKKFKIGTNLGYYYGDFSEAAEQLKLNIEPAKNLKINLKKLSMGRLDLVVCDYTALVKLLKDNTEMSKIISISPKPVHTWKYSIGISKYSDIAPKLHRINELISELKENDLLDNDALLKD